MNKMMNENGGFEFEGRNYINTQQAYLSADSRYQDPACFEALAICQQDEVDEDGIVPAYSVVWQTTEEFRAGDMDDFGDACEWDSPMEVKEIGGWHVEEQRFV